MQYSAATIAAFTKRDKDDYNIGIAEHGPLSFAADEKWVILANMSAKMLGRDEELSEAELYAYWMAESQSGPGRVISAAESYSGIIKRFGNFGVEILQASPLNYQSFAATAQKSAAIEAELRAIDKDKLALFCHLTTLYSFEEGTKACKIGRVREAIAGGEKYDKLAEIVERFGYIALPEFSAIYNNLDSFHNLAEDAQADIMWALRTCAVPDATVEIFKRVDAGQDVREVTTFAMAVGAFLLDGQSLAEALENADAVMA